MKINQKLLIKLILLLLIMGTTNSCDEPYKGKPKNTITVAKAKELSNNFNARHDSISAMIGKPDSRSSWHSLDELEQYIAYIKKEGAAKGLNVDGIRIYLGAYGANEAGRENYSTVFLVPTVSNAKKDTGAVGGSMDMSTAADQDKDGTSDSDEISPLNYGGLGKPPSSGFGG
jgi:hypothetical protein